MDLGGWCEAVVEEKGINGDAKITWIANPTIAQSSRIGIKSPGPRLAGTAMTSHTYD
jgi:hypothetical protein